MDLKYIYNEHGQKEAVIIPINEWENLHTQENKFGKKKTRLSDMIGVVKGNFESIGEVDSHINKLRDEWG